MKSMIIVALALVAVAVAAPAEEVKILRAKFDQQPNGPFVSEFETENGIDSKMYGELKQTANEENKPVEVLVIRGSYSYLDNDGKPILVSYIADENGFRAEGDTIPQAPVARR